MVLKKRRAPRVDAVVDRWSMSTFIHRRNMNPRPQPKTYSKFVFLIYFSWSYIFRNLLSGALVGVGGSDFIGYLWGCSRATGPKSWKSNNYIKIRRPHDFELVEPPKRIWSVILGFWWFWACSSRSSSQVCALCFMRLDHTYRMTRVSTFC